MQLYHHSRDPQYRAPGGAQPCDTEITLRLRVEGKKPDAVNLRVWFGEERFFAMQPVKGDATLYEAVVRLPASPCLFWYDFQVWCDGQFYWYGNAEDCLGGEGAPLWGEARSFQITVYDPAYQTPAWTRGAVFYQIFPDRFARDGGRPDSLPQGRTYHESWDDSPELAIDAASGDNQAHDFFGGTLRGIASKLPYLASLGVTALYLNPIFWAGTNHRFDTTDWQTVDPLLGTGEDFAALCKAAEAMGIRIVLDGVFSHAGSENPFFRQARSVADSPYRDWFVFEHWPDRYKSWWGFPTLPELNKRSPAVLDYFLTSENAVVKKWPRMGSDGWRIDVADELPMEYLAQMRRSVKAAKRDAVIIGEVWEDASNKVAYGQMRSYCLGDTLDGVMNYPLRDAAIGFLLGRLDASGFKRHMGSLYENYPAAFAASLLNVLSSHDRPRILNTLAGVDGESLPREQRATLRLTADARALGVKRLLLMLHLIIAMPGMPCVYYGDEAGMQGASDPFNRAPFPWGREDAALTDDFRTALARKREVAALSEGTLVIEAPSADVVVIKRETSDEAVYTAVNRGAVAADWLVDGKTVRIAPFGCAFYSVRKGDAGALPQTPLKGRTP